MLRHTFVLQRHFLQFTCLSLISDQTQSDTRTLSEFISTRVLRTVLAELNKDGGVCVKEQGLTVYS